MTPPPAHEPTSWGTRRRLQALASRGWSPQAIEAATGIRAAETGAVLSGRRQPSPALARRVAAAYDLLWDQPPPHATPRDRRLARAARTAAAHHGWPPPMAWDDDIIDQPAGRPAPGWKPRPVTSRKAIDLDDDMTFLREHGGYRHAPHSVIAARLGVTRDALQQAHLRAARYRARAADREAEAS